MRLSKIVVMALKGSSTDFRTGLANLLETNFKNLNRWIDANKNNGPLTTQISINMMLKEFDTPGIDKLLFENESAAAISDGELLDLIPTNHGN